MMLGMRTTLTLDPDVVRLLEAAAHRSRKSFKELVNDALRRGLGPASKRSPRKRYRVKPHAARLVAGCPAAQRGLALGDLGAEAIDGEHDAFVAGDVAVGSVARRRRAEAG